MSCVGCFKPAINPSGCIKCKQLQAKQELEHTLLSLGKTLPPDLFEEVEYELYCSLPTVSKEDENRMVASGLAALLAKCADTAIYLAKKRNGTLDDLQVVLFDLESVSAYISNLDVVIRITDFPLDMLDGLRNDLPAYDYNSERFIPNPMAQSPAELDVLFEDMLISGEHNPTVTIPVIKSLDHIYNLAPTALDRRSYFAVLDVGYGHFDNALVIPRFEKASNGKAIAQLPGDYRTITLDRHSKIGNSVIVPGVPYVGIPTYADHSSLCVNVYKYFEDITVLGLYKLMNPVMSDDLHPYDLALYAENDLLRFTTFTMARHPFENRYAKMQYYATFKPIVMELEYLYETLILFGSLGYEFANITVRDADLPILIEGVPNESLEFQPSIQAIISLISVGADGRRCEKTLERELVPF